LAGRSARGGQGKDTGKFNFLVVNDIHYINAKCATFLGRVLQKVKEGAPPEFCLLAGDLSHHGTEEEFRSVKEIFSQMGIPVFVLPGNHDYKTQNDRAAYDKVFPGRSNYYFDYKGWFFVGFDSTEGLRAAKTKIHDPATHFIGEALRKIDKTRPVVAFTHFPLGETVTNRPLNADAVLELFKDHNLQTAFGGHFHSFTERSFQHATLVTNRCCSFSQPNHDGTTEKGFFLCEASDGKITRAFVEVSTAGI